MIRATATLLLSVAFASASSTSPSPCTSDNSCFRIASWNVYYKALDDPYGRAAITQAIDNSAPFDFIGVVEATGDTPQGQFPGWTKTSKELSGKQVLSGKSGYETIALFYNASVWKGELIQVGEFESGRPFLLGHFSSAFCDELYIMVVHLNHFFVKYPDELDPTKTGSIMADAFANASAGRAKPIADSRVVIMGDFNEYEWGDFQEPYFSEAKAKMKPLWTDYFHDTMKDAVPPKTISCCTKWAVADRDSTNYTEWRFEYDHMFYSAKDHTLEMEAKFLPFLPYKYPGLAGACSDPDCTGEIPPGNVTATHQGSWHRGVQAEFRLAA
jgi:endonuclease/exonuclease/phosphatase family metal-dependent hydrolase